MAIFKQVWQFRSVTSTWSDVYYKVSNDIDSASDFGNAFVNKRLALLSDANVLQKIRVSDIASPRVATTVSMNLAGLFGAVIPSNFTESLTCSLVSSNPPASRKLWLRGTPEDACKRNAAGTQDILDPGFAGLLSAWFAALQAGQYIILKQKPVGEPGIVQSRCTLVDGAAGDGTSLLTFEQNILVIPGNTILLSNFPSKDLPGLKGKFKVVSTDGNKVKINYSTPNAQTVTPTSGFGKKLDYFTNTLISGTKSKFAFLGGRQTKNLATGSRGARSAKRQRTLA